MIVALYIIIQFLFIEKLCFLINKNTGLEHRKCKAFSTPNPTIFIDKYA